MNVLTQSITRLTYADIEAFCQEGYPEGVEIDYKKDYPQDGIAKHFAAFSNRRGGILIIGVDEDRITGLPKDWQGIPDNAKLVERIHQVAGNVSPLPSYMVNKTNAVNGNVFVLVRVFEGDATPYYVLNDPNIWIRTGNVNKPFGLASPEWTELLIGKHEKADRARSNFLSMAQTVFQGALDREETRRRRRINAAEAGLAEAQTTESRVPVGMNARFCTLTIQPFFPREALISPGEMMANRNEYSYVTNYGEFPAYPLEAIPSGVLFFRHGYNGIVECQQVFAQGLIYDRIDVSGGDNSMNVLLGGVAGKLYCLLKSAGRFYQRVGYQGTLRGAVSLENIGGATFVGISLPPFFDSDTTESVLPYYEHHYAADTRTLNDPDSLKTFYCGLLRDVFWAVGFQNLGDGTIYGHLRQIGAS